MAARLARPPCAPGPLGCLRGPLVLLAVLVPFLSAPAGAQEVAQPEQPPPAPPPEVLRVEPVVVTATRTPQRLADVPASVTVLTKEDIAASPAQTVDDLLRQVPGFSLFRRSSSLVTHPTTQGVSLRGIGPSGASRSLVLLDGVPINDPFGGWVYWSRIPRESIRQIDLVRGALSNLYGSSALGGAINITTEDPAPNLLRGSAAVGDRETKDFHLAVGDVIGPAGLRLDANYFETEGFFIVRERDRGPVDVPADSAHRTVSGKLTYAPAPGVRFFLAGNGFREDRGNGTRLQENETRSGYGAGGMTLGSPEGGPGEWGLTLFTQFQTFNSTFVSIRPEALTRTSENKVVDQKVPTDAFGGVLQWTKKFLDVHTFVLGGDFRWIDGESDERTFAAATGAFTGTRDGGGTQYLWGVYAQEIFIPTPQWQVTLGARFDYVKNFDAFRIRRDDTGALVPLESPPIPDRSDDAFSPKVAVLYKALDWLALRASAYKAFRAPTLNELYRQFTVRTVTTLANENLGSERLTGAEGGFDLTPLEGLKVRVTGFWNRVKDPVANVTLDPPFPPGCPSFAGAVCRKRQNLGETRVRGLEVEAEYLAFRDLLGKDDLTLTASYLFDDTEVLKAPARPSLVGLRIPQVPKHQATAGLRYRNPWLADFLLQARYVGGQFENDENTLRLPSYVVLDLSVSRRIGERFEAFLGVENLLDKEIIAGRDTDAPDTLGTPRLIHGGLAVRF